MVGVTADINSTLVLNFCHKKIDQYPIEIVSAKVGVAVG
jgi:hypothetical protein